jgi:hypothetical protein
VTDDDMGDILFLDRHPGWTWGDLMATPEHIVAGMKLLDFEKGKRK